jgi:A/G-specific adenine glycosylase
MCDSETDSKATVPTGFAAAVMQWYEGHARDLPWRAADATPWGVLVSEFMLQQTPVARVLPMWQAWMARWPRPALLATEPAGDAVRMWGRLGYPRRALRLHAAAREIVGRHDGEVPTSYDDLRALPGVGDYTAAAVAAFAFGARIPVLDTNVRRVHARVRSGVESLTAAPTAAERAAAWAALPVEGAAGFSVAVMELGALVCTTSRPGCATCPVAAMCAWHAAGHPASETHRSAQTYAGTDRQVRGRLLAVLRESDAPVASALLDTVWHDHEQRRRALDGLLADGLVQRADDGRYQLPA